MNNKSLKIIHAARIQLKERTLRYLLLYEKAPQEYLWYMKEPDGSEKETGVTGRSISEAIRQARKEWQREGFRTLHCGFRYTLPERDEHGGNALFYQMVASYSSPNGVYFDEELGHNCFVQAASQEALSLRSLSARN